MNYSQESIIEKRRNSLKTDEYFNEKKVSFDAQKQVNVVKICSGEWYVSSKEDEMIGTILGSCVSACIRDPIAHVGGMNHFMLPGENKSDSTISDAARYGVFAMERLINAILKAGGHKDRFEIKVFGGGNVINNSARIGSQNACFIRDFLRKEGYRIASEDLEGNKPRHIHYYPYSGKVMMRLLHRREDLAIIEHEAKYTRYIAAKPIEGEIELF